MVLIRKSDFMKDESIRKAREILIERILNSNIDKQDKIELAIHIHHIFQEENYKDNVKALQKVRDKKRWR